MPRENVVEKNLAYAKTRDERLERAGKKVVSALRRAAEGGASAPGGSRSEKTDQG